MDNPQKMEPDRKNRVRLFGLVDGVDVMVVLEERDKGWVPWAVHNSYPKRMG